MKNFISPLLLFAMLSCKQKEPSKSDFMQRALKSDDYKLVSTDLKMVNDSLELFKKKPIDTSAVIYIYNMIAGGRVTQAKNMNEVKREMDQLNKDSSFLKNVQRHLADTLEKSHQDSLSKNKN